MEIWNSINCEFQTIDDNNNLFCLVCLLSISIDNIMLIDLWDISVRNVYTLEMK